MLVDIPNSRLMNLLFHRFIVPTMPYDAILNNQIEQQSPIRCKQPLVVVKYLIILLVFLSSVFLALSMHTPYIQAK